MVTSKVRSSNGHDELKLRGPSQKAGRVPSPAKSCKFVSAASWNLIVVVLLMLFVSMTTAQLLENEIECIGKGGVCAVKESCIENSAEGECPRQENAVCCSIVDPKTLSCRNLGGICRPHGNCGNVRDFGRSSCEEDQSCCLLIY